MDASACRWLAKPTPTNLETQHRVPTGCEKVFEDERSGVSDFQILSIVALYFNRRPLRGHDADAQGNSLFRDFVQGLRMPTVATEWQSRFVVNTKENGFEPPHVRVWVGNEDVCCIELNDGTYMDHP